MKKIAYCILLGGLFVTNSLFLSCENDEAPDPFRDLSVSENLAPFVRITTNSVVIDATQLSTSGYEGVVDDPADNVASWTVGVRKTPGPSMEYTTIETITTFPSPFAITGEEIATTLGIPSDEIQPGDNIEFQATATGKDGKILTFADLGGDLAAQEEQLQAFQFNIFVSCPFIASEIVGTYNVTQHRFDAFFGPQGTTREIIAGPGENQYTIIGGAVPLDGADDLIINVDPITGVVTSTGSPNATHFNTFGPGVYGNVGGFTFSCVGFIDLTITSPGFIPNFFTLEKQ
jgi:hypothetical protein